MPFICVMLLSALRLKWPLHGLYDPQSLKHFVSGSLQIKVTNLWFQEWALCCLCGFVCSQWEEFLGCEQRISEGTRMLREVMASFSCVEGCQAVAATARRLLSVLLVFSWFSVKSKRSHSNHPTWSFQGALPANPLAGPSGLPRPLSNQIIFPLFPRLGSAPSVESPWLSQRMSKRTTLPSSYHLDFYSCKNLWILLVSTVPAEYFPSSFWGPVLG